MKKWSTGSIVFWIAVLLGAVVAFEFHWMLHRTREAHMGEALVRNPPWLLWGGKQVLKIPLHVGNAQTVGQQLVKIAYKRPEAWRFLFVARILEAPLLSPTDHPITQLIVDFNVEPGIGRSSAAISRLPNSTNQPGFERYIFAGNPLNPIAANAFKWSTTVSGPNRDDVHANASNITELIVGQDIQVNVTVFSSCSMDEPDLVLEVGAFFSPNVHLRPEWWKGTMGYEEDEGH